jgi:hypothetical protein
MEVKVWDCGEESVSREARRQRKEVASGTYGVVDDILGASIVVDVDGDATECRDLGMELVEAGVVLALALVGFGHGGQGSIGIVGRCRREVVSE